MGFSEGEKGVPVAVGLDIWERVGVMVTEMRVPASAVAGC